MKQIAKITVYDAMEPVEIKVYQKKEGAHFEIRIDNEFWRTCENGREIDNEIRGIISLYRYDFFPRF